MKILSIRACNWPAASDGLVLSLFNHVSEQHISFLCPKVFALLGFGSWHVQFSGFCPWQKIKSGKKVLLWTVEVQETGVGLECAVQHQLRQQWEPLQSGFLSELSADCMFIASVALLHHCLISSVCQFLACCQSPTGGFAGGPGQHAHLAPTYAAVNALCIIGTEEAYNVIDR